MSDKMCPRGRTATTTVEDIVTAAKTVDDPVFTAKEIAERVSVDAPRVRDYLNQMHQDGVVQFKRAGSGKVWWLELS
jgi:Mn-dependent DtxR family transcriptional regulator